MLPPLAPKGLARLRRVLLGVPLGLALILPACGKDEDPRRLGDPGHVVPQDSGGGFPDVVIGPLCLEGKHKPCKIYLPEHNGVQMCIAGQQYCADGRWGECVALTADGGYVYVDGGAPADGGGPTGP